MEIYRLDKGTNMTEWEKAQAGYLYDANYDDTLITARLKAADLCFEFNHCKPSDVTKRQAILQALFGEIKEDTVITPPFYCDYGVNVRLGRYFYSNYNCTLLDAAPITFGDYVFIAPNCVFSTAGHALDSEQRNQGLEIALPITVGDNVWIGANVVVLPGVTIGNDTIIGAGSVVTKDIPAGVIAVGNPCRVVRAITEEDKQKYPRYRE